MVVPVGVDECRWNTAYGYCGEMSVSIMHVLIINFQTNWACHRCAAVVVGFHVVSCFQKGFAMMKSTTSRQLLLASLLLSSAPYLS